MWTRKELKTRSKALFKMNYWKAVLAALVLTIIAGWGGMFSSGGSAASSLSGAATAGNAESVYNTLDSDELFEMDEFSEMIESGSYYDDFNSPVPSTLSPVLKFLAVGLGTVIILIIAAIGIAMDILLINPLEVGIRRFFSRNLFEKARIRELAFGFDHNYRNVIKVMFFRDLHTILWTLLFIIPGIVKTYEYRMIPYLLAEYPDMPKEDAFAISKHMMHGNKWKAFVLDLSFILWILGSFFTLGLLGVFYVDPYMAQTGAALYDALKAEKQPFAQQPAAIPASVNPGMDNPRPQDYNENR